MGKKNKDKKGKGKEKTELKTEKKAAKRAKKEIAEKGEEDIEQLIAKFTEHDKRLTQVIEEKCPPPTPRSNMTLVSHPEREELIVFGGEYFTGSKMHLYNDLFFYNISKDEWTKVMSPKPPPPRSSHQAVVMAQGGGQMWVFGGEFSSHSQNQFFHYRDLWVLHLKEKKWEEIKSPGGPSARSGHRMVAFKKQLFVFGGFHDNARDYKYFNDIYSFDTGTYVWTKLEPAGNPPSPRSGCLLFATPTRLLVYGGYSKEKVKRDVDKGFIHTDMFALLPEGKSEGVNPKWRWQNVKQSGIRPSPRCGMSAVIAPGNRGVLFGGVFDEEEDEEQLDGVFYNDLFSLDLDKGHWYSVNLRGERPACAEKKRRRKQKQEEGEENMNAEEGIDTEDADNLNKDDIDVGTSDLEEALEEEPIMQDETQGTSATTPAVFPGGEVFSVTVGPQISLDSGGEVVNNDQTRPAQKIFRPSARMKPCLAVKESTLYLYGGTYEEGDRQITLSDLYTLNLGKLDTWQTVIGPDPQTQEWQESSDDDDDEKEEDRKRKGATAKKTEEDESDDDSSDIDMTFDDAPKREEGEMSDDYFSRTQDYWLTQAKTITEGDGISLSDRKLLKLAKEICQEVTGQD